MSRCWGYLCAVLILFEGMCGISDVGGAWHLCGSVINCGVRSQDLSTFKGYKLQGPGTFKGYKLQGPGTFKGHNHKVWAHLKGIKRGISDTNPYYYHPLISIIISNSKHLAIIKKGFFNHFIHFFTLFCHKSIKKEVLHHLSMCIQSSLFLNDIFHNQSHLS
jgi:hypothetical protein